MMGFFGGDFEGEAAEAALGGISGLEGDILGVGGWILGWGAPESELGLGENRENLGRFGDFGEVWGGLRKGLEDFFSRNPPKFGVLLAGGGDRGYGGRYDGRSGGGYGGSRDYGGR